jgi:hypothetical protein
MPSLLLRQRPAPKLMNTFKNMLRRGATGCKLNMFNISGIGESIMYVIACYFSYLAISIGLTIWVARTLKNSGRVFLIEAFRGNEELADSVNRLLVVGFYLINVGYIALALKTRAPLTTAREVIELESTKLGVVLLILGGMHFFNILVLSRMRKNSAHALHA